MLGFLGNMTLAPCCVTMGLLRFLGNATIKTETLLWLWHCDIYREASNELDSCVRAQEEVGRVRSY
jgi:hypothetical protein